MTKLFYKVILERNKYAHGVIYFKKDYSALIKYKDEGIDIFGEVSAGHIKSFNEAVLDVQDWLVRL